MKLPPSPFPTVRLFGKRALIASCCLLLTTGTAFAAVQWRRVGTVTTLTPNHLCKNDGLDIICDSTTPYVDASGNVGIGTPTPGSQLQINDSSDGMLIAQFSRFGGNTFLTSGQSLQINPTGSFSVSSSGFVSFSSVSQMWLKSGGNIYFQDNSGNNRVVVNASSGNVGIGTASPSSPLHVKNDNGIKIEESSPSFGRAVTIVPATNAGGTAAITSNSSQLFTISNVQTTLSLYNGNVGIGTTTSLATTLDVNGSAALRLGTDLTTTGSQNNVSIGTTSALRYSGASAATFTGLAAGANGQVLYLHNASSSTLTLSNQSASSTAANRIITGTGADLSVPTNTSVTLQYDSTDSRWRVTGSSNSANTLAAGTTGQVQFNGGTNLAADSNFFWDNTNKRLGIGSSSPTAPLDVNGNINATSFNSQLLTNAGYTGNLLVGAGATSTAGAGGNATAIGYGASASYAGVAVGKGATTSASGGTAIGYMASAPSGSATAVGVGATAATYAVAIGDTSKANAYSVAVGAYADASTNVTTSGVALGRGATLTGNSQFVVGSTGSLGVLSTYLGSGVTDTAPVSHTINATGGSGTDIAGANLTLAGGRPTGAGTGGYIAFQTAAAGASGTTLRSLSERMRIDSSGNVGIGTTSPAASVKADINGMVKVAGSGSEPCTAAQVGSIRYNPTGNYFELCSYP